MKKIIGCSFATTTSFQILKQLQGLDFLFMLENGNIEPLLEYIKTIKPDYIIGLGDYSGKDQDTLRIESYCSNTFRNSFISGNSLEITYLTIPEFDSQYFKVGKGMGNGFCNKACYELSEYIEFMGLQTQIIFIHVPNNYLAGNVVNKLSRLICRPAVSSNDFHSGEHKVGLGI